MLILQGVFHVELKYTSRGPRLIEVNCRMGGGPVRNTNLLVWGVDLVEEHLLTCAGIPSRPPVAARPLMYIAEYSINAQKSGKMQHVDFLKVNIPQLHGRVSSCSIWWTYACKRVTACFAFTCARLQSQHWQCPLRLPCSS